MHSQPEQDDPSWGMRINSRGYGAKGHPSWATHSQREKWNDRGLILWDSEARQVTKLSATQAIQVLNYLSTNDDWKRQGITVGEPATRIALDDPDQEPQKVLINKIDLNAARTQELFVFLQSNEAELERLSKKEEKEISQALHEVYGILLGEEVWNHLGRFYQNEPEKTLKFTQELIAKRLDALGGK